MKTLIFPCSCFAPKAVDEDMRAEYEAGDGQVSGLSEFQDYAAFYRALYDGLLE